jgi:hypothetical protein
MSQNQLTTSRHFTFHSFSCIIVTYYKNAIACGNPRAFQGDQPNFVSLIKEKVTQNRMFLQETTLAMAYIIVWN